MFKIHVICKTGFETDYFSEQFTDETIDILAALGFEIVAVNPTEEDIEPSDFLVVA